jgi:hypothetical protein
MRQSHTFGLEIMALVLLQLEMSAWKFFHKFSIELYFDIFMGLINIHFASSKETSITNL